MALDLSVRYPAQVLTVGAAYPFGKARNVTVAGDGTGTPWEADLVNDWIGFLQALLVRAAISNPSGTPDAANASQYLEALEYIARHPVTGLLDLSSGTLLAQSVALANGTGLGGSLNTFTDSRFVGTTECVNGLSANEIVVSTAGIFIGVSGTTIGGVLGLICEDTAEFRNTIFLTGTGRIRERVAHAPNADHTFAAIDGTVIIAGSSVSAPRTWTLNDATEEGYTLQLANYSSSIMTLRNQGGSPILYAPSSQLAAAAGDNPGTMRLIWVNNGTYVGWSKY